MASNEMNDPWCKALHDCTACLREQKPEDADRCLAYLIVLAGRLRKEGIVTGGGNTDHENDGLEDYENDDKVPRNYPPRWTHFCATFAKAKELGAIALLTSPAGSLTPTSTGRPPPPATEPKPPKCSQITMR